MLKKRLVHGQPATVELIEQHLGVEAGYSAIMALREEVKQQQGQAFALNAFHERFLSYGSAPVNYIRGQMLARGGRRP